MQEEPTSLRIDDPGVRALFTEPARFQSWLDVEAALAQSQAELGIIPEGAAREIIRKAHLSYLDLAAVHEGLARTGHPLVPLVWALDRACEGDAGGYVHWGATTQNVTQTGQLLQVRRAHAGRLAPGPHAWPARGARHVRLQGSRVDRRAGAPRGAPLGV
jgi:adenylosuccinate lyase